MEPGGFRDAVRAQRFLLPELLVAAAILAAGFAGILPFSATPFLVIVGVVSLWLRGQGPRAVGLAFRSDWVRTVSVGIGAGIVYQGFSLYIAEPAIARLTGKLPDVSLFAPLAGNRKSTRLNSSHLVISYAVFCLKKKKKVLHTHFAIPVQHCKPLLLRNVSMVSRRHV